MWLFFWITVFATPLTCQEKKKRNDTAIHEALFDIPGDIELMVSGDMKDYFSFFFLPIDEQRKLYYEDEEGQVTLAEVHKPITLPKQRTRRVQRRRGKGKPRKHFNHDVDDFNNAPNRRWMLWDSVPNAYKYFAFWHNSYYGKQDYVDKMIAKKDLEKVKKERLMNINLQFLIHARYKIGFALKTRSKIRDSPLYIMGYLISKIRRFQYIQQNLAYLAHKQWRDETGRNFKLLLRTFEEMMRIDVDIKDLIDYVKDVDDEYESYCSTGGKCWYPNTTNATTILTTTDADPFT